jgi:hypothetical protein
MLLQFVGLLFVGAGLVEAMPAYQGAYYAAKESSSLVYGDISEFFSLNLVKFVTCYDFRMCRVNAGI